MSEAQTETNGTIEPIIAAPNEPEFHEDLEPANDRHVVALVYEDDVTRGGILLPESAKEKPMRGVVRYAGKGGFLRNGQWRDSQFKVGDLVLFGKHAGTLIKWRGEDVRLVMEEDILAKIVPAK